MFFLTPARENNAISEAFQGLTSEVNGFALHALTGLCKPNITSTTNM